MSVTNIEIRYGDVKGLDKPMASPRPRFKRIGRSIQTYMPSNYTMHKHFIQKQMPRLMTDKPLKVTLLFEIPMAKSWSKKKKAEYINQPHTAKPDIDNLVKTVLDAANNHIWIDDGQVYEIHTNKIYSDIPLLSIILEEIDIDD
ncbi:RusA family crossover junction endodeoxyribonuclease [Macrococcoides bohemicum]|uniref:RusA family crossover junction endodeoxyribonuclease n=1 Tax=Macrococcoides bohemicum TaxID=1903056 RepID=UPI00105A926D|nr:RusA family crossover junction endodeoxyribonuclease [Macrococcus bohemicus]TDL35706.1 RusA family crossover junction endodeoxyribonuclease [Macrococcus bohemicus]